MAAALLLAARSWFPFVGEPVADDFDYLHHALISGGGEWLDGGGSHFYWRPLARQLYFRTLGVIMLAHPAWIAVLHVAFAAATAFLLYRTLRGAWAGAQAAAAATFFLVMEAARPLVSWPTNFEDLGAILFSALALHEASRSRLSSALVALLAALLCKETAVVTGLLLPWLPGPSRADRRLRIWWALASGLVVVLWGATYWAVLHGRGQLLLRDTSDGVRLATPWVGRWLWACANSFRDALSLPAQGSAPRQWLLLGFAGIAVATALVLVRDSAARLRLRGVAPWLTWGTTWFALAAAVYAEVYPDWRPYRSPFGAVGLGVALAALLGATRPMLLAALVVLRLAAFALAPGPPTAIEADAPGGFSLDFAKLVRLQRLVGETRRELEAELPRPASGARVAGHNFPQGALYAFVGDKSFQVWYQDTTVHWVPLEGVGTPPWRRPSLVLEFQPTPPRQVVRVSSEALLQLEMASQNIARRDWHAALVHVARAESLERDPGARVFASVAASKRALALGGLERGAEVESIAARGLAPQRSRR